MNSPSVSPQFVRPHNDERAADPAYWFLRTVQTIVEIGQPRAFEAPPPSLAELHFAEPWGGAPLRPGRVFAVPGKENVFLVLDADGARLHLLSGPTLKFGQTFEIGAPVVSMAVDATSAYLLDAAGKLLQVPLLPLVGRLRAPAIAPLPLSSIRCLELPAAWSPVAGAPPPAMACPLTATKDAVLLFDPSLAQAVLVETLATHLQRRELRIAMSHQLRASLALVRGFAVGARLALFDAKGMRLYLMDPFEAAPRLRLLSGPADPAGRHASFGPLGADGQLVAASAVCHWSLARTDATSVASCMRFMPAGDAKAARKAAALPNVPVELETLKRQVLEQAGFAVLYDAATGRVATCSLPPHDARMLKLMPEAAPMLLPLTAAPAAVALRRADHFAALSQAVRGMTEVAQGPSSSLMFWTPGEPRAVLLRALGDAFEKLFENQAFVDELNRVLSRRVDSNDTEH